MPTLPLTTPLAVQQSVALFDAARILTRAAQYDTLTRDQVRAGMRVRGRFVAEPNLALTNADKVRLSTALNVLKDKGRIGMTDDLVWLL